MYRLYQSRINMKGGIGMWKYRSPIGNIYIKYIPSEQKYGMFYNDTCWEACDTPGAEADNVYLHCTGCHDWDKLDGTVSDCPSNLSDWEKC